MNNHRRPRNREEALKRFDGQFGMNTTSKDNVDSKFLVWFEAQFGPEPLPGVTIFDLFERIASMAAEELRVKQQLERKELWEAHRDAALKAWCAKRSA